MPTLADYKQIVQTHFNTYASEDVLVHKFDSIAPDIYRQGARTYDEAVTVKAIVITEPDQDILTEIGKRDEDLVMFVFSVKQLEEELSGEPSLKWITVDDIIEHESIFYSITDVKLTGRVHGGITTITVDALELVDPPV